MFVVVDRVANRVAGILVMVVVALVRFVSFECQRLVATGLTDHPVDAFRGCSKLHSQFDEPIWQFPICLFLVVVVVVSLLFLVVLRLFLGNSTNEKLPYHESAFR